MRSLGLLAILFLMIGCATAEPQRHISAENTAWIQKGTSTRSQIEAQFGSPSFEVPEYAGLTRDAKSSITPRDDRYTQPMGTPQDTKATYLDRTSSPNPTTDQNRFWVIYDENDVVTDYGITGFITTSTRAANARQQEDLVEKARRTVEAFTADDGMKGALKQLAQDSKGLFIVPRYMRAAFLVGAAEGSGVLIVRNEQTNTWSEPVFYHMVSASFGLQAGGDVSEMVLIVRTERALQEFYSNDFKLGANIGIAAGPVGAGMSAQGITADIVSYAKTQGVFAGVALEGAHISIANTSNNAYYGRSVTPTEIIIKQEVSNHQATTLHTAAENLLK